MKKQSNKKRKNTEMLWYVVIILLFLGLGAYSMANASENPQYDMIFVSWEMLLKAFFSTIYISVLTLIGALVLGFALFVMMRSKIAPIKVCANVFNEVIMGTPLLVMIFVVVYVFGASYSGSKLTLGIIALILYNAPYIANAYESTSAVVDSEQYIVMDLYNFKWYQRYYHIILPQMIKPFIPSLINNLSSVIKGSALLNIVAVHEITYIVTVIASRNFAFIEGYYTMWLLYLIITIPLSLLAKYIAKRVAV